MGIYIEGMPQNYSLYIHPKDLYELRRDVWCDDPVPGKLKIGKVRYDIDISYRGAHTREFSKKSYYITFIKPALFGGAREIHLNAEFCDPSLIRNKLSFDFFKILGVNSPQAEHVSFTLNGKYMGVYLQLESVDHLFLKKRKLPAGPIYYAVDDDANFSLISPVDKKAKKKLESGYERKTGTDEDDAFLRELIYQINTISQKDFGNQIQKFVDVDKYLRWLTGVICTQNYDGFVHNYSLYRNSASGLFEMIPWDYDGTWGRDCNGKEMRYNYVPIEGYNTLTVRILDVPQFRAKYRALIEEVLDTTFTVEALENDIITLYKWLRPSLLNDPYKEDEVEQFDKEPDFIFQFIKKRNEYLKEHLSDLE